MSGRLYRGLRNQQPVKQELASPQQPSGSAASKSSRIQPIPACRPALRSFPLFEIGTSRDSEDGRRRFVASLAGPVPLRRRPGPEHRDTHTTPYDHEGAVERLVEVIETMAPAAEFQPAQ